MCSLCRGQISASLKCLGLHQLRRWLARPWRVSKMFSSSHTGKYLDQIGAVSATACKTCARGTYSRVGADSPENCLKCPAGTYLDGVGTQRSDCVACPAGMLACVVLPFRLTCV
jgi:hypothetical protein